MAKDMNRVILSGMLACSNMGQKVSTRLVDIALRHSPATPDSSAELFCEQFMESYSHERIFYGEARMWHRTLKKMTDEEIKETWPTMVEMYQEGVKRNEARN